MSMVDRVSELFRLDGQIAIVTGGAAGIGRGISTLLAEAGATVVIVDRDTANATATAQEIITAGGKAQGLALDVSDDAAVMSTFDAIANEHGRIDILVNNAGIYPFQPIDEGDTKLWDKTFAINTRGPYLTLRAALPHMPHGSRIVNISSIESIRPSVPGLAHYGASKAALVGLTRGAAVELAPKGIRVNAVLPGVIANQGLTPEREEMYKGFSAKTPGRRVGLPEDIAGAVLFLVSGAATYVHGASLVVDGGVTISGS